VIDSHCHLADPAFASELDAVVGRARAAGLERALVILAAGDDREVYSKDELVAAFRLERGTAANPVFDTGKLDNDRDRFGLFTMRERVERVGGRLEIDSVAGRGTRVCVVFSDAEAK